MTLGNGVMLILSLPKSSESVITVPSSSIQASTFTKSETKEGMEHFKTAAFPRITYSVRISAS